ncbi:MAG: NAD(P)-dependent oxidoreductase [Synechococcales bacterium]|nr:NAD(P)-dependent oxidoreductase [Synechococcales bacterium]
MQLAWLGTGLMGEPMALRLMQQGHSLIAYNRTPEKLASLQAAGADIAPTPEAAIASADGIFLMLTHAAAISATLLTPTSLGSLSGKTVVQMGTIAPEESIAICQIVTTAGGHYLEAPVLGSIPEAKLGQLLLMVGAEKSLFEQWLPILQSFDPNPTWFGAVGTASMAKLALNQLIGALTSAFGLSLALVQSSGVEVETFMQILRQSALYAPTFDKKLQRMCDRHYEKPNFPTQHLLKDINLAITSAEIRGLNTQAVQGVRSVLEATMALGLGDQDYSALFSAITPLIETGQSENA